MLVIAQLLIVLPNKLPPYFHVPSLMAEQTYWVRLKRVTLDSKSNSD